MNMLIAIVNTCVSVRVYDTWTILIYYKNNFFLNFWDIVFLLKMSNI